MALERFMIKNGGQTLTEFMLVFVVLLMAALGAVSIYKKFWSTKYEQLSRISIPAVMSYVK